MCETAVGGTATPSIEEAVHFDTERLLFLRTQRPDLRIQVAGR